MWEKAGQSLIVGAAIAVVCFIPYLIFQYRRYGRFSPSRMVWMAAMLLYLTGLVAYTLFPLPGADWCTVPHERLVLDPTIYVRQMWQDWRGGESLRTVLTSWTCVQQVLNVLLFMPLGIIMRHMWKVGVARITATGLAVSVFIEATQYTGNWFIAPCPYRLADTNDLVTNTLGAFLGGLVALITPRLATDADSLEATRGVAKPVTRGRRWTGMLFDLTAQFILLVSVDVAVLVVYAIYVLGTGTQSGEAASRLNLLITPISNICCFLLILLFCLTGSGASIGQRLVYLKPVPTRRHPRVWLFLRAMVTQGVGLGLWLSSHSGWALAWILVAVVWVLFRPRGLSFIVTGCELADSRPAEDTASSPTGHPDSRPAGHPDSRPT